MKIELIKSSHSVGESNLHLQLTPAYRQEIFDDEAVRILARDYMLAASRKHGFKIAAVGFGIEHAHLFLTNWKNFSPAKLAQILKGYSSRMMRKFHKNLFADKLYGNKFWTSGYFYRTVGAVNSTTVKKYVTESQEYGYKEGEIPKQRHLIEFAA